MPKMVRLAPNDDFEPADAAEKATFAEVKRRGKMEVPYVTAMENMRNSKGMLMIGYDVPNEPAPPGPRHLEDMDLNELKVMMLSLGIKSEKKMKRDDVIRLVRAKMDEFEIEE